MCLLTAIHQTLPGCPLLLFGNRDEQRSRTSLSPQIATDERSGVQWLAGTDAKASGTWLGINEYGLVVAVTNRPEYQPARPSRSRGLLCRDLLACEAVDEAVIEAERQLRAETYSGCNLLLFTGEAAAVIEVGDDFFVTELPPGIHIFGNGPPNDTHDARVCRVREELGPLPVDVPLDRWLSEARNLRGLHDRDANRAICRHGAEWGTVSSTITAVTSNIENARYLYNDGLPCETPFDDHSPALRTLLAH